MDRTARLRTARLPAGRPRACITPVLPTACSQLSSVEADGLQPAAS
jgi:hypothetical protein